MNTQELMTKVKTLVNATGSKQSGFVIGATSNYKFNDNYYFTPIRESKLLSYMGVIVRNVETAKKIVELVDGLVDYIFVDSEKKIPSASYGPEDVGNLEKMINQIAKNSKIFTYKGNDLTASTTDSLLRVLIPDISGVKVAILGVGNIGTKLALSLLERGANVSLYSHQISHALQTASLINRIKLKYVISECIAADNIQDALTGASIVLATSNKKKFIGNEMLEHCHHESEVGLPILIDVGKGCFKRESLERYPVVYRIDVEDALSSEFDSLIQIRDLLVHTEVRKSLDIFTLVRRGVVGLPGEIVVDNPNNPTRFLGVCSTDGNLLPIDEKTRILISRIV